MNAERAAMLAAQPAATTPDSWEEGQWTASDEAASTAILANAGSKGSLALVLCL